MQPFLDSYKLAGAIGIIADKNGRVHYRNLLGYADVEAKKTISNRVHRFPEAGGGLFSTTHDIRR
jgi:chemotaxis methyl-accepting protein methylase